MPIIPITLPDDNLQVGWIGYAAARSLCAKRRIMISRMIRPKAVVLPDSALLSKRFTHRLVAAQAYYRSDPTTATQIDGFFARGIRVVLLEHDGGPNCRVTDEYGVPCYTAFAGLQPLITG